MLFFFWEDPSLGDYGLQGWIPRSTAVSFNRFDNIPTFLHNAKNDMTAIQMGCFLCANKELRGTVQKGR